MCISALPGDEVMDCMKTYALCPPGKPGVKLILLRKPMNVTFQYSQILLCFRTIYYVLLCVIIFITVCIIMFSFTYIPEL